MKKILYLSFILLACHATGFSQSLQYQWARGAGGFSISGTNAPDEFTGMATDRAGNTYVAGLVVEYPIVEDTVIRQPNGNFGAKDAFIAKYDRCGRVVWYHIYGTLASDGAYQVSLSPDEHYFYTYLQLGDIYNYTCHIQMETGDTVVGHGQYLAKINAATGKIIKLLPYNLPYPTGGTFYPDPNTSMHYFSSNRVVAYVDGTGNFDGTNWNDIDGHVVVMDSDLHVVRWALIDTGASYDYQAAFGGRSGFISDRYGNLYSNVYPIKGSGLEVQLFDSVYTGFDGYSRSDMIVFQMDTNLHLKRIALTNMVWQGVAADENLYLSAYVHNNQGDYWASDTFHLNSQLGGVGQNSIFKIDTNLHLLSYCFGDAQYGFAPSTLSLTKDKVYAAGWGFGYITWGADTVPSLVSSWETLIWEIPKATVCPVHVFVSPGYAVNNILDLTMRNDEQGNLYLGGVYHNILYTAHDTIAASGGSASPDIYVEKWGFDCADSVHTLREPLEPTALVATATGAHSVQVVWQDQSRYETGFHIWRSPDGVSSWTLIDSVAANVTQYIDASVQPNTAYWYRAAAFNANGDSYYTNTDSALTWRVTAIDEVSKDLPYVNLYPNPARSQVTMDIYSTQSTMATIRVTGISGELISTTELSLSEGMNHHPLAIGHMAAGVYSVMITTPGSYVCRRLVRID